MEREDRFERRVEGRFQSAGAGAGLQAALDDVAWAAGSLADELDTMIARREEPAPRSERDAAMQVAAAARLLPRRR